MAGAVAGDAARTVGVVAFGSPPGVAWSPLDGHASFETVEAGYLIAPADVALWQPSAADRPRRVGTVDSVFLAPAAEAAMTRVDRAAGRAGRGLEGDRYVDGRGTFSSAHDRGHDLTLIEGEVLDTLGLPPDAHRRNVVTRDIDLNALVGHHFIVGGVECFGQRLCEPCAHLERLAAKAGKPGTLRR